MTSLANLVDYHVHTARCGHASGTMEEYVARAREIGLGEMGFSDHFYVYWLPEDQRDPELGMAAHQLGEYVAAVRQLQEAQSAVRIRLALEVDYVPGWEDRLANLLACERWDYLLGSVHFIDAWGFDDSRYVARYQEWDIDQLYERYFELAMAAAESGLFDIMTHLDLPKKFGHRPTRDPRPLYERVAACLKRADVCVEVNTAGLRKPVGELYPAPLLLQACHRAGVPATLSSDAHRPEEVGQDFDRALALLREVGYTEVAAFEGRRRTFGRLS
ncbi:MAG: histidinol-phosphatase HisJ family protein [Chloroflexi bacterium]|nr:histidinol-phosphatase HisJ family protein [Chloroflexota bacterium]